MMTHFARSLILALVFQASFNAFAADALDFPKAEKKPVIDSYFGVDVLDNYQWMESATDPAVKTFATAQNDRTRKFLDAIPERAAIKDTLTKWYAALTMSYSGLNETPAGLFANKFAPPKEQPLIVLLPSPDAPAEEKIVLDPQSLDSTGATAIDWWVPSPDGKLLAVSLSKHGSEDGTLRIFDVATGKPLPDSIPRVQYPTGGGSVAWAGDGKSLFYTRYPAPGERPAADEHFFQQIWHHTLGDDPKKDSYSLGKDFPRIAEVELATSHDGSLIIASVSNGDGGDYEHFVLREGKWTQITHFPDAIKTVGPSLDGQTLYLLSRKDAPKGKVLTLAASALDQPTTPLVPESDAVIQDLEPSSNGLYLRDMIGGPSRIRFISSTEKSEHIIATPDVTSVREMHVLRNGQLLYRLSSYIAPTAWWSHDPATGQSRKTALASTSPVDFSGITVTRTFAKAPDGTSIPLNIIKPAGFKPDGSAPAILYGYGSYGINMEPNFDFSRKLWLERGGLYIVANLRGGGEYGEAWHKAANLTHKQTTIDDLATCARFLVENHYTRPDKLAIEGGSAGGLLMGGALTQHPELFRAVVSYVGFYDALRTELEPNGEFNITEFGTVKDRAQFNALHAYSPYHHVVDKTKYPSVLLTTGLNDGRVAAWHSLKMVAALQEATSSPNPILLRVNFGAGHGMGTALSITIDEDADVYSFLFKELEVAVPAK
ncbi:MAG: prolyl oligopeptidase family serine peptidase [Chthoniobacterales bacterium]